MKTTTRLTHFTRKYGRIITAAIIFTCLWFLPAPNTSKIAFPQSVPAPEVPLLKNEAYNQAHFAEIDTLISQFRQNWGFEGVSVAVTKAGKLLYAKGFGWADREKNIRLQPYHQMRIASASKWVTALGIMHLVEKKKLSLDEQVFGPKGILKEKSYCEVIDPRIFQITVEDLLRHQGGFCRGCEGDPMFRGPDIARIMQTELPTDWETTVKYVLTQQRLLFEPGTVFNYSNFGYKVLEKVIEAKTKMTYEGYLQKYFLLPLDIHYMRLGKNLYKDKFRHETRYYDQDEAPLAASLYPEQDSLPRMYGGNDIELLGGAGGWIASPVDLLKLLTIADGHSAVKDYFSAETLQKMITPSDPTHRHTVIGWKSVDSTAKTWIRTGTYAGTNALLVRGPEEFSYCVLTNKSLWSAGKFNYETKRLMKQVIQKLKTVKLQTKSASDGLL